MTNPILLGINIDHIATLRQARGTTYPDILEAAKAAERGGADGITVHLREDRRHIQDKDVEQLQATLQTRLNLEMAVTEEMLTIAENLKPEHCCLVPEKREELTTEGGLDVVGHFTQVKEACQRLQEAGIQVSLFIDPDKAQIEAAHEAQAEAIELHTGTYADAKDPQTQEKELTRIKEAVSHALEGKLITNAGHGLHYTNTQPIAAIKFLLNLE